MIFVKLNEGLNIKKSLHKISHSFSFRKEDGFLRTMPTDKVIKTYNSI